jgi:hypothetical protein
MAINLSRRNFLQHLATGAACLAFTSPSTAFAIAHKYKRDVDDLLSFTDLEGLGPQINTEFPGKGYLALHEERTLSPYMIDDLNRSYAEWLLKEMYAEQGLLWDKKNKLIWTYQHYGFCDHSNQCYKLLNYCMSVQDFLYNRVTGLLDIDTKWEVLGEDFMQHPDRFSGLVGRYTYLVYRIHLLDSVGELKDYGLIRATPVNRAINYITADHNVPNTSLMYIIPGNTSLVSPFSELLHISTHGPSRRLADQLGRESNPQDAEETSRIVGETITESAAILMAQQYLQQYRFLDRMTIINSHARSLASRYGLIRNTVAYMANNGVQQTLNSFTDDPLHLVKEISHSFR